MVITTNLDAIREDLGAARGILVSDAIWDFLLKHGHVERYLNSHGPMNDLIALAGDIEKLSEPRPLPKRQVVKELLKDARLDKSEDVGRLKKMAQSLLIAREARMDWRVEEFREQELENKLLTIWEIRDWARQQLQKDGPIQRVWITIPAVQSESGLIQTRGSSGEVARWEPDPDCPTPDYQGVSNPLTLNVPTANSSPDGDWDLELCWWPQVKDQGTLGRLRDLSKELVQVKYGGSYPTYPWSQDEAATFILTDLPPVLREVEIQVFPSTDLPAATRIVLVIDPTISHLELGKRYQEARDMVLPDRYRTLTAKQLRLAAFIAARPADTTWEEHRLAWNEHCRANGYPQEYTYPDAIRFSRAARGAIDHLLELKPVSA